MILPVRSAMSGRDHVGNIVTSVTEVQHEERSLDEVANANLADNHVLDDIVLIGQDVGLTSFNLDDLIVSLDLNTTSGGSELHGVTADVDLDGKGQGTLISLLGEDGKAGIRSTVGRDESVAAGQIVVQSNVVEGDDCFRSNIANANPTSLDSGQLRHAETSVTQNHLQVLEDVNIFVVAVHQIGVDMEINILLVEFEFHLDVTSTRSLLDGGGTMGRAHLPIGHQSSLEDGVGTSKSHLAARRHVLVVDVVDIDAGSGVVQDSLVASLSHGSSDTSAAGISAISIATVVRVGVAFSSCGTLGIGNVADHLDVYCGDTLGASLGALILRSFAPDKVDVALNGRFNGRGSLQDVLGQSGPASLDVDAKSAAGQTESGVSFAGNLNVDLRLDVERLGVNVNINVPLALGGTQKSQGTLEVLERLARSSLLTSGNSRVNLELKLNLVGGVLLCFVDYGLHVASASGWIVVEVIAHLHEAHGKETRQRSMGVDFGRLERLKHNLGNGSLSSVSLAVIDFDVRFHAEKCVGVFADDLT